MRAGELVQENDHDAAAFAGEAPLVNGRPQRPHRRRRIIIDLCNPTAHDRAEWLHILKCDTQKVMVIYFDVPPETCIARIKTQGRHPTLNEGDEDSIESAVHAIHRQLALPFIACDSAVDGVALEPGFAAAHVVHGLDDMKTLVRSAFFDRNLHSRMPLVPKPVCLKLLHECDQLHSSGMRTTSYRLTL